MAKGRVEEKNTSLPVVDTCGLLPWPLGLFCPKTAQISLWEPAFSDSHPVGYRKNFLSSGTNHVTQSEPVRPSDIIAKSPKAEGYAFLSYPESERM